MSIYGTIHNGTTGLITYSKGLGVISNNVSNMNSPGFKRNDLMFKDLFYNYQLSGNADQGLNSFKQGNGVGDSGTTTSFAQGDLQQTGNDLDVAIDGNGFFVLREGSDTQYSRVGQFRIDEDGYVVSSSNGYRVAGLNDSGALQDINLSAYNTSPAVATSQVTFFNNLSTGSTEHTLNDVTVIDSLGNEHTLTLTFANNSSTTPRSWLIEVQDADDTVIATGLEIRFQGNGSPEDGFNSVNFTFSPDDAEPSDIELFFGEVGSFTGTTSFAAGSTSDMAVESTDGREFGKQSSATFSADGSIEISFTNGETVNAGRLALAWINDLQSMKQLGNGLFEIDDPNRMTIGAANEGALGEIVGGSIEISNVELSQEFTDLVIVQRGFQVSSQVVNIANEMLQQLLDSTGGRG